MKSLSQAVIAVCAGGVLLAVAGCGGPAGQTPDPESQTQGLEQLDPCGIFTDDDLQAFGLEGPGSPETGIASEPGCYYNGDRTAVVVYKNQEQTVEAYGQQSNWAKFDALTVDGRKAASAIDKTATQARICSTLFDAGGGSIIVDVSESRDQGLDECAESQKIAEAIAPRMPR
ncbi:DUF3558 domain-containing protein [Saccharopolyspora sp. NPDC000359]|uniref:DUF3558 domain-containing protein n=1 Tax=Saccharopolyspora sp. NPDC000359 TaxID=3154251 RepID=UPI00332C6953